MSNQSYYFLYRHYGDLGELTENSEGVVSTTIVDRLVSLVGTDSVINRSIVVS